MTAPEFSRPVDRRHMTAQPDKLVAGKSERQPLADRIAL
jgi:hypothetical protein